MLRRAVISLLIVCWNIPWLLHISGTVGPGEPLKGYLPATELPVVSWRTFAEGSLQQRTEKYLITQFPYRSKLIRLHHQLDWELFRHANVKSTVVGLEDYLFARSYVAAARGIDALDPEEIRSRARALRSLSDSAGVPVIVALAPGKGHFYREFLPPCSGWKCGREPSRGHRLWKDALQAEGMAILDLHGAFDVLRQDAEYPLFPKTGIHWSKYSMVHVMPALMGAVDNAIPPTKRCGSWSLTSVDTTQVPRGTDDDIEQAMNLLCDIPDLTMGYPKGRWTDSSNPPSVLLMGDSYAWTPVNMGIQRHGWQGEFWYYNEKAFGPLIATPGSPVSSRHDGDLLSFLRTKDAIVLLSTDANLSKFPFGFAGIGSNEPMEGDRAPYTGW